MQNKPTFSDHFTAILPKISAELIAEANRDAIRYLCSEFPFDAAPDFGFETRLGTREAYGDFFLQINKVHQGAAILAGKSSVATISPMLANSPQWMAIAALFASWHQPDTLIHQSIGVFWLEFDFQKTSFNPVPNIFFSINGEYFAGQPDRFMAMNRVMDEVYRLLFGMAFPGDIARTLRHCIHQLPATAGIYQIGCMLPRNTEAIRLILTKMSTEQLLNYLQSIDWQGDKKVVVELISRYASLFDYAVYNLDIGKQVMPSLGIEMYFRNAAQPAWEPRWNQVFELLHHDGLLLAGKRKALEGFSSRINAHHFYPVRYFNGINHLKLSYKPGKPVECKAYFGTMIR